MMVFRQAVKSYKKILKDAIDGTTFSGKFTDQFQVVGFPKRTTSAKESRGKNRQVRVYYKNGDFYGQRDGAFHNSTIYVELIVTSPAKLDSTKLLDPNSTDADRAAAIAGDTFAAMDNCNELFDELLEIIYAITMDLDNSQLGVEKDNADYEWNVNDVFVRRFEKDDPHEITENAVLTGTVYIDFKCAEPSTGVETIELEDILYSQKIFVKDDTTNNLEIEE